MRILLLAVLLVALASCDPGGGKQGSRVFIRSAGEVVSTYDLASDGRISRAVTRDALGQTTVHDFRADGGASSRSVDGRSRQVTSFTDPGGLVVRKLLRQGDLETELTLEYFYKPDGRLDGVVQRDAAGNLQAKASDR